MVCSRINFIFTFTFTLPFLVLCLYNLWLITNNISAFFTRYEVRSRHLWGQNNFPLAVIYFSPSHVTIMPGKNAREKFAVRNIISSPSPALCLQFVSKTLMNFSLATYSYIMEHSGCHHCFIWWAFWIEIRTKYIVQSFHYSVYTYDAENNFSTSVWLVFLTRICLSWEYSGWKPFSRRNRDVIAARAAYTYVCGRGMRKRGRGGGGEGDMIHPSRRETDQLCSDSGIVDVCMCVTWVSHLRLVIRLWQTTTILTI